MLLADNTTYLPGEICFATSLQAVLNRRTFKPASWHIVINIPLLNTEICGALFSFHPVLFHTSSASEEFSFPLKNPALLHLFCYTFLLPSLCLQH